MAAAFSGGSGLIFCDWTEVLYVSKICEAIAGYYGISLWDPHTLTGAAGADPLRLDQDEGQPLLYPKTAR